MIRTVLCAAGLSLVAGAAPAEFRLHVLHINDLHSRIEPINKYDSTCAPEEDAAGECFGGIARVAAKIRELRDSLRAAGENVIVLDAGDQFQGSLVYTTYKGRAAATFMEMIGFDAMAVGNHEFDDGPVKLADFIDRVTFPVVSGNLDTEGEPLLRDRISDHVVLPVAGEMVGIVSALATDTTDTSSPGPNVLFFDEITALAEDVATLEAEGVTKIIALTHVGLAVDREIAAAVPGIDAIVGGHSHTYLNSSDPRAAGPYPVMVEGTPIVQAYANSKYVGHLVLTFDDAGNVTAADGAPVLLDVSVAPAPDVAQKVAEIIEPLAAVRAEVVAETAAPIDGDRLSCRNTECEMGNLVADAMLERVRRQGVQFALTNGGGLRASIDAGPVTMGEVLTVLPFQNTLSTFTVSGAALIDALENGVSQVEDGAGRFPQVAGLRFTWDPSADPGTRIVEVLVAEAGGWQPIDPEGSYLMVSNNYVRGGGDGYSMFEQAEDAYDYGPGLEVVVSDYLAGLGQPYSPYLDGRIATAR